MTDPLSLTEAKRLAGTADTILLRASRSADLETPIGAFLRLDDGDDARLPARVRRGRRAPRSVQLPGHRPAAAARGRRRRGPHHDPAGQRRQLLARPPVTTTEVPDPLAALRAFVPAAPRPADRGHAALHRRRGGRARLRRDVVVRAVGAAAREGPGGRAAGVVHRDRPRARVRPPQPPAVGHRLAAHRGPRPRGPLPDRRASDLRGPGADGTAQPGRDDGGVRPLDRDRRGGRAAAFREVDIAPRAGPVHPGRRAREGRDRRRRGDPGRARPSPVVRAAQRHRRRAHRRHRPVPRAAPREPVARTCSSPARPTSRSSARARSCCSRSSAIA